MCIMLKRYEQFLKEFDKVLEQYNKSQESHLKCQKGCSFCCKNGDYPFSRLEMEYLMNGFMNLPSEIKQKIRENINNVKGKDQYVCPFLINDLCILYERRGIVCRTHGLAYLYEGNIKLPECANIGLNYSDIFNKKTKEIIIDNPIKESLRIDSILTGKLAEKYELESGDIRKLIDWF